MSSFHESKVLPDVPSSSIPSSWEWLTNTSRHDGPLPQTPRLRPVRSRLRLAPKPEDSTETSPSTYISLMPVSPISYSFPDPTIDVESYTPNIQFAEQARVIFSGKAVIVHSSGSRRGSIEEQTPRSAMTSQEMQQRTRTRSSTLSELRLDEYYRESEVNYRASTGYTVQGPERNSVTLRRLRSSAGRPRVESIPGVNKNTGGGKGETIWWQSEIFDSAQIIPS